MNGIVITLNGTEVDSPSELQDFTQEFIRDEQNRILRYDYPDTLTFAGDGYAILDAAYQDNFDNEVVIQITDFREQPEKILARGVIKMSNCTWNLQRKTCETQVDDFVFQRQIFARKSSPMIVTSDETFNGLPMTSLEPIDITVFTASTGADIATPRKMYDIIEVMAKLIEFLTNGAVAFSSPWYDALPDDERMAKAWNEGKLDQWIRVKHVEPALRKKRQHVQTQKAEALASAMSGVFTAELNDGRILRQLKIANNIGEEQIKTITKSMKKRNPYRA